MKNKLSFLIIITLLLGCNTISKPSTSASLKQFSSCEDLECDSNNQSSSSAESTPTISQIDNIIDDLEHRQTFSNEFEIYCFYTDPHFFLPKGNINDDISFADESAKYIKSISELTNSSFVMCGGDLLNNSDTKQEACSILASYKEITDYYFNNHYFLVGNHDTNYQGDTYMDNGDYNECILEQSTINSLLFDGNKSYYCFDTSVASHYCFDSGIDWTANTVSSYQSEQLNWFAESLLVNKKKNIDVFVHMALLSEDGELTGMMDSMSKIIEAFNERSSVSFGGIRYDYYNAFGKIHYIQSGHIHKDLTIFDCGGVPIIVTSAFSNNRASDNPTFDIVFADYDNFYFNFYRIGNGNDRSLNLKNNNY